MIEKVTDGSEAEVVGLEKDAHHLQQLASLGIREEVGEAQEKSTDCATKVIRGKEDGTSL
jgi:hypothetical protein